MPDNDREVFAKLVTGDDDAYLVDLLVYARFSHDRHRWIELCIERTGLAPTIEEENRWIADQHEHRFTELRASALRQFDEAARRATQEILDSERADMAARIDLANASLDDAIETARADAVSEAIVKEVGDLAKAARKSGGFFRQIGLALLTAALAPIIIGLVVLGAVNYTVWAPEFLQPATIAGPETSR